MRERRADIEAAKGLAILLVVFGHLVARQDPTGVNWYEPLRRAVYAFHMPLFLYLSGVVAVSSGFLGQPRAACWRLAGRRAQRLLVPFFGLGLLAVLGKCALAGVVHVDHAPPGLAAGLLALVWNTGGSPALFIWYLFVLFVVSIGSVLLLDGRLARLPWLLAAALVLFWVPLPEYMYLDRIGMFAPFFLMGAAAARLGTVWEQWLDRAWRWAMVLFCACFWTVALVDRLPMRAEKLILLPVGAISLPAIHGCLRNLHAPWLQRLFLRLGRYSFMIYLFNIFCIGAAKAVLLLFWSWDGVHFYGFAPLLMGAGLLGPLALKHYVFGRIKWLDRMTD